MRLRPCFAAALLTLIVGSARAQEQQIPRELALALIPYGGSDGGEIIVGQVPPDLATTFTLPPGARVLGSFVSLTVTQVIITMPGPADSALAFARRALVEHGWTPREQPGSRFGGLRYGSPQSAQVTSFCKAGSPDGMSIATQFHGSTTLLRLTRSTGTSMCDPAQYNSRSAAFSTSITTGERMTMDGRLAEMPLATIPPLYAPGDFRSAQVCRSPNSSMGSQTQTQPLRNELSLADVLAHYGKQLDSAGWKSLGNERATVAGSWLNEKTGQEVTVTIARMPNQGGCYEVSLRATAPRNAR